MVSRPGSLDAATVAAWGHPTATAQATSTLRAPSMQITNRFTRPPNLPNWEPWYNTNAESGGLAKKRWNCGAGIPK